MSIKSTAVLMIIVFICMIITTHYLIKEAINNTVYSHQKSISFAKTKRGRDILWRLKMAYLVELCGIIIINFVILLKY